MNAATMFILPKQLAVISKRHISNVIWSVFIVCLLIGLDVVFYKYIDPVYKFNLAILNKRDIFYLFFIIILMSYLPRPMRYFIILIIFIFTSAQYLFFHYFGTYIQPIHYIQLLPDLGLIAISFLEIINRMYAIFALIIAALLVFIMIERLAAPRMKSYLVIPALLGLLTIDVVQTYPILNTPGKKMSGSMTSRMLPGPNRIAVDNAYRSLRYLAVGVLPKMWSQTSLADMPLPEPKVSTISPQVNVILVIGETVRASQLGILGYKGNDTTPRLSTVDGLFSKTIYSAGTMTRTSWVGILHRLERPGIGEQYKSQSNCVFRLAKQNGFTTHFVYGYDEAAAYTLRAFMCPAFIDKFRSTSDFPKELQQYDRDLIEYVSSVDLNKPNFIVLAPRGAHTPYIDKSPKELKKFNSEYDNAIGYTDVVLSEIIDKLKERSKLPTYFIFTSDHGELLEGESDRLRHGWFREDVFRVPFLFLGINAKMDALGEVLPNVESHFDLTSLVINLLGYDVKVNRDDVKDVYVNGSDLYGLAGYMKVRLKNGNLVSQTVIDE